MMRTPVVLALLTWIGATLVLAERRWFRRVPLAERLRPYTPRRGRPGGRHGLWSVASVREVVGPLVAAAAGSVSRVVGAHEELSTRLRQLRAPVDPTGFRLRQVAWSGAGALGGLALGAAASLPAVLALGLALAGAMLAFLLIEQRLTSAVSRRRARLAAELPVVAEQIGLLLGAGFSLGAALHRVARRGTGVCAEELSVVTNRVRQGLTEVEALGEWAQLGGLEELSRLVSVLALNREAGDLGRLISEEARSMRQDAHRRSVEVMERRAQLVWVPVTVAALVPGAVLMGIPFITALQSWSAL